MEEYSLTWDFSLVNYAAISSFGKGQKNDEQTMCPEIRQQNYAWKPERKMYCVVLLNLRP